MTNLTVNVTYDFIYHHCATIVNGCNAGITLPERDADGKCSGYAGMTDEPCDACRECPINVFYEGIDYE